MKKIVFSIASVCMLLLAGCEDFLDTSNYSKKDTSNFPITEDDGNKLITGIYYNLSDCFDDVEQHPIFVTYMASDEAFGGGSTSNVVAQSFDRMQATSIDAFEEIWASCWKGIFRANNAIASIPIIEESKWQTYNRDNLIGQAYFLRAFFYWQLIELFETVPLITSIDPVNLPRANVDELYAQVTSDLLKAIELIGNKKYGEFEKGRASKWAAQAYLARIFLFYTGFYKKDALPTVEGKNITKTDIIQHLEDCIKNSGFDLVADQRTLWPYTNQYTKWHYPYTIENNLDWVGNGSKETMWNVRFNLLSGQHNRFPEYLGLRYRSGGTTVRESFPYGQGYTNGPINPRFVQGWKENPNYGEADTRLWGSILDVKKELPKHLGDVTKEVERSDYHGKKYIVVTAFSNKDANPLVDKPYNNYTYIFTNTNNSNQYGNRDDVILMRFADVLLMHSELTQTVDGINRVRVRANLKPIGGYSLEALQNERKYELAFEGIRWGDLRRWYPETAGEIIEKAQEGVKTRYREHEDVPYKWESGNGFAKRYKETRGFFRIPDTQINLSEGVLVQTKGWEDEYNWMFTSLPYTF